MAGRKAPTSHSNNEGPAGDAVANVVPAGSGNPLAKLALNRRLQGTGFGVCCPEGGAGIPGSNGRLPPGQRTSPSRPQSPTRPQSAHPPPVSPPACSLSMGPAMTCNEVVRTPTGWAIKALDFPQCDE